MQALLLNPPNSRHNWTFLQINKQTFTNDFYSSQRALAKEYDAIAILSYNKKFFSILFIKRK